MKAQLQQKWFPISDKEFHQLMASMRFAWEYEVGPKKVLIWLSNESEAPAGEFFIKKEENESKTKYLASQACRNFLNAATSDLH